MVAAASASGSAEPEPRHALDLGRRPPEPERLAAVAYVQRLGRLLEGQPGGAGVAPGAPRRARDPPVAGAASTAVQRKRAVPSLDSVRPSKP
jgi:hypothetical protein